MSGFAPRLTQNELAIVMKNSRASVSLGSRRTIRINTYQRTFAIGTPAVYVNEGGFTDTIIDKENGGKID